MARSHLEGLIDCCIGSKGSHFDVARVVHAVLSQFFKYDGKNNWFYRRSPTTTEWIADEQRKEMEIRIKVDVYKVFSERALYWQRAAMNPPNGDLSMKIDAQLRSVHLMSICMKIGKPRYLRELMKECRSFFVHED